MVAAGAVVTESLKERCAITVAGVEANMIMIGAMTRQRSMIGGVKRDVKGASATLILGIRTLYQAIEIGIEIVERGASAAFVNIATALGQMATMRLIQGIETGRAILVRDVSVVLEKNVNIAIEVTLGEGINMLILLKMTLGGSGLNHQSAPQTSGRVMNQVVFSHTTSAIAVTTMIMIEVHPPMATSATVSEIVIATKTVIVIARAESAVGVALTEVAEIQRVRQQK